jgi:peptide/nickel transport system permease protein
VLQLFGASIIVFVIVRALPADPAEAMLGASVSPEQVADLQERLGLNEPLPTQYWIWLRDLLVHGDLGRSWFTSNAVTKDLGERLPATIELIGVALLLAIVVMIPLGVLTARKARSIYGKVADRGVFGYGMLAGSVPDFLLGILLVFVFYSQARWAPAPLGRLDIAVLPPEKITGLYTIDSLLTGSWDALRSALAHLVLPVVTLTFVYGAPILKMTRATVKRMLDSEFVEQARAVGLSEKQVLRIAFKNSLPPVIVVFGVTLGYVIGGAVLVESIFSWGGLGQYAVQSIANADFAAIQGFVLVATAFSIFVYLLVDVLHYVVDPRIQA